MRTARKESASGYYHVMVRGINKSPIFMSKEEKEKLIQYIKDAKEEIDIYILAYCIMNNHMHLLVKSEKENLAQFMKKIGIRYAMYYNKKHKRVGSVFQDRFKSQNIEDENYLLSAIRYIHNNPIKAEIVKKVTEYKYSSINEYYNGVNVIIDSSGRILIKNYFKNIEQFIDFHEKEDMLIHLDIKEDMKQNQLNKAQMIIDKIIDREGMGNIKRIRRINGVKREVINELLLSTNLTAREIAELTYTSRSTVSRLKTERKNRIREKYNLIGKQSKINHD